MSAAPKQIETMAGELRNRADQIEKRDSDTAMHLRWAADEIERLRGLGTSTDNSKLPRCESPEIDDYRPWLLRATKDALAEIMDDPDFTDARSILRAIDAAIAKGENR